MNLIAKQSVATLGLLWVAAVFDPIGEFYIRYAAISAGAIALICIFLSGIVKLHLLRDVIVLTFSILMPIYGILLAGILGGTTGDFIDTSYIGAAVLFLFAYLYIDETVTITSLRIMVIALRALAFLILVIFVFYVADYDASWSSIFVENEVARISTRQYGNFIFPYIYFYSSPMLIYLICYDLEQIRISPSLTNYLLLMVSDLALGLSGTRAHMLIALALPFIFLVACTRSKLLSLAFVVFVLFCFFIFFQDSHLIELFFDPNETSNSMKIEMYSKYAEIFSNSNYLLFGQGYNAHVWSIEFKSMLSPDLDASKTEFTYFELIRVYGVFIGGFGIFLLSLFLWRIYNLGKTFMWIFISMIVYLINASLNPYFFSSNGILPFVIFLAVAIQFNKSAEQEFVK